MLRLRGRVSGDQRARRGRERFVRRLKHEQDALSIDRDGAKLLRDDHLEHLGGLRRGAVKRRSAEQRDPVVQAEMVHERIDPPRRVWSAGCAVFGPQDEVEPLLGTCKATLPDHFYAGLVGDFRSTQKWKRLRRTKHDHHPVHDALGNAEALVRLLNGER